MRDLARSVYRSMKRSVRHQMRAEMRDAESLVGIRISSQGVTVVQNGKEHRKGPVEALDILQYVRLVMEEG